MPSQNATERLRAPQRQRGHQRVAALLEAATTCFVEKGYDATTMTEIAARANASIGSLYQFFPTKERLAQALIEDYAQVLYARMDKLVAQSVNWDLAQLSEQLIGLLVNFRKSRPAFVLLAEAVTSLPAAQGLSIRRQLRIRLTTLLARRAPQLDIAVLERAAVVTLQMMKAALPLQAEPDLRGRPALMAQLAWALQLYLSDTLASGNATA